MKIADLQKENNFNSWNSLSSEEKWKLIRQLRNEKLSESDWTQLPDSPIPSDLRQDWAIYRQHLRDSTRQSDNPDDIEFPDAPSLPAISDELGQIRTAPIEGDSQ